MKIHYTSVWHPHDPRSEKRTYHNRKIESLKEDKRGFATSSNEMKTTVNPELIHIEHVISEMYEQIREDVKTELIRISGKSLLPHSLLDWTIKIRKAEVDISTRIKTRYKNSIQKVFIIQREIQSETNKNPRPDAQLPRLPRLLLSCYFHTCAAPVHYALNDSVKHLMCITAWKRSIAPSLDWTFVSVIHLVSMRCDGRYHWRRGQTETNRKISC